MASPKLEPVVLSDEERLVLAGWARRRKTAQALALRARIVLRCADGDTIAEVAHGLEITRGTVFGYATARAYAGHSDNAKAGATATYVRASLPEIATALAALTGEPHPLAGN